METTTQTTRGQAAGTQGESDIIAGLLEGYRFTVCEDAEATAKALEIRRQVYVDGIGYDVPVPDQYDARSWLLLAEDLATGQPVGCMRLTPHFAGDFESEAYFTLPKALRSAKCVEINRFAILPAYRKGKTFLPIVSTGLFKLCLTFLESIGAHQMVIASKPERVWTYEWLGFERTGAVAQYGSLDDAEHELLVLDVRRVAERLEGNPFKDFFCSLQYEQVVLPRRLPSLGVGIDLDAAPFRMQESA
jgi:N-acyl-L-homoserine lactone synthetase